MQSGADATADASDGAASDVASDAAFDAACPQASDLVVNGNFEAGTAPWITYNVSIAVVASGPCGHALHLTGIAPNGEASQRVNRPLAKGTRLRLRAWFSGDGLTSGELPPSVSVSFLRSVDGGEVSGDHLSVSPPSTPTSWVEAQGTITLTEDQTAYTVNLNTKRVHDGTPGLYFAAVSLTTE
ncbi:MAG: carbohydrate binding domain-containing protein [Myxococcales bacterium]|nr:carbohydrate binding domain-containing protein [Myxococcales bacterium]